MSVELNSSTMVSYEYDSASRMTQRIADGTTTNYTWDGWDLIKEIKSGTVNETTNYLVPFREVLAFERGGDWFYLHGDGLSSTQLVTDENGSQVGRFIYGAWGEEMYASESIPGILESKFVGGLGCRKDAATGLVYMRHRWYDCQLQRFISRDPIGLRSGANLFCYASNTPVQAIDPAGLQTVGKWMDRILAKLELVADPVTWADKIMNRIFDNFAPVPEVAQEIISSIANSYLPGYLKKQGVDLVISKTAMEEDGVTYMKNDRVTIDLNSELCNQDRLITTLHEIEHARTAKKDYAEAVAHYENFDVGNPDTTAWESEVRAWTDTVMISRWITPVDNKTLRFSRVYWTTRFTIEDLLKNTQYNQKRVDGEILEQGRNPWRR